MKKYTFAAYDWHGHLVELSVIAESKAKADKIARDIFNNLRKYINTDEGIYLQDEEDYA